MLELKSSKCRIAMPQRGIDEYFPIEEYNKRQKKISQLMDIYKLDAPFILKAENILYFTEYACFSNKNKHRPYVLFLSN
jgi:hypothetical protein